MTEKTKGRSLSPGSIESPAKMRKSSRGQSPQVDSHGFRRSQVSVDAEKMSAYERMGGDGNRLNMDGFPKNKTIKQEDDDTDYIIDGSLRRVEPYYFTYMTHCKERWRNKNILDVFSSEFRLFSRSYYEDTIKDGRVSINNEVANIDSIIRNGDLITHRMHRHEPAVTSDPIKIVHEDVDYVVIDKPSGIPVHPTGRYRHNCVTFVLEKEMGIRAHPCNRLDRLTSGLMLLGKNGKAADKISQKLKQRQVTKQYVAKVVGEFPSDNKGIVVDEPILTADPRLAFNIIDKEKGKAAKTFFKRLSFNGKTSLVLCKPLTGRTHQIRVHLQYLGYPIVNDPIYSSPRIWGDNLGRGGDFNLKEVRSKLAQVGKTMASSSWLYPASDGEVLSEKKCEICHGELYTDPGPNDLDLYLHAFKYCSKTGGYQVEEKFRVKNLSSEVSRESTVSTGSPESTVSTGSTGSIGSIGFTEPWSYQTELPDWALEEPRKYMALALDEAKKCEPTTTAFCVGAVLVNGGEVLSTGYSRELEGNTHAEQNALDKYFLKTGKRDVPPGTELYTTMEPCSKRLSGNLPCLNRILELKDHITTCYVGVMEPSTFVIKNVSYEDLTKNGISYIKVSGFEEEALKVAKRGHLE
ncbi:hypothetical protein FOA43_002019 [Brettanomyces nanus]|uniref:tRNA pseudouridine(32) synthase n=1 Tax=Eeniella nana TaxID=13502 RepID=A0A875RZU6_EENNA|nr:uncharacterized protein FOA43_002019 [Brettanomyces nanus]QPG74686.1 hypothetical protein FOA43_002019 [Brettanomyces nanus]